MPLVVRKPFDVLVEVQKKAQTKPEKVNPEYEEKPVVQQPAELSEDYHGGSEQTFSLPQARESGEAVEQDSWRQPSLQSQSSSDAGSSSSSPESGQPAGQQEQPAEKGEADVEQQAQSRSPGTTAGQEQSGQSQEQPATNQRQAQSSQQPSQLDLSRIFPNPFDQPFIRKMTEQMQQAQQEQQDKTQKGEDAVSGRDGSDKGGGESEGEEVEGKANESNGRDSGNKGDRRESEGEEESKGDVEEDEKVEEVGSGAGEEDEEEVDSGEDEELAGEESEEQEHTHQYNVQQVVDVLAEHDDNVRYYQAEFYRFIEMIAEEKLKLFDYRASEEYNIKKLMFRQYEKKPLSYYRMSRVRDSVVLILDNSGSMQWWAKNLQILAGLALARRDVEVYIAPNGHIVEKILPGWGTVKVSHDAVMKALKGRKIIYVGDFDGANTPVELSFNNDVVWVCPESRYRRFRSHDWVDYDEEDFRGAFLRVYDLDEMFHAFRRLLSYQHFGRVWIDLHEDDTFEDDLW